ncbi:MAG: alpha/beta fold hydrolase [Phycisphaerae bacterium]
MTERRVALESGALTYLHGGEGPLVVLTHALGPVAWGTLDRLVGSCSVAVPVWERSSISVKSRIELEWFEALIRDVRLEHAALCAWSMAGPTAIEYAAEAPAPLSRLILVDVAGLKDGLPPLQLRDLPHLLLTRLLGRPTRGFVRCMWRGWVHRRDLDTAPLIEATYRFFRCTPGALMSPPDDDDANGESLSDLLASIDVPTLVLAGRYSTVLGPEQGEITARKLPRGKLIVFEHSSHTLQLEEPEKFQEAIAAFVTEPSAGITGRG